MESITIKKHTRLKQIEVPLASSKSESNRALIINQLAEGNSSLINLSSARDTQIMKKLLDSNNDVLDAKDAGTAMRFMTAYLALKSEKTTITGTERMCKRPIATLVEALQKIGANVTYKKEHGYPPLTINKMNKQNTDILNIPGNISSQYISALLMIAPVLPRGLKICIEGEVYSLPYIKMTLGLMEHFGVHYSFENQIITIPNQSYSSAHYAIESDWSGASYWYGLVALAKDAQIKLLGLKENSLQGDRAITEIMDKLGVASQFDKNGVILRKKTHESRLEYDFKNCPDLAQTVIAVASAKQIELKMTGLESLRIKETDRTFAMAKEVEKIGAILTEEPVGVWNLTFSKDFSIQESLTFDTYDDHRMAMALAPLCMKFDITINDPKVVWKSYPEFWDHLKLAGLDLTITG